MTQNHLPDPYHAPAAGAWRIVDGATLDKDLPLTADAVVIGSGAGGGTMAERLALAGLKVILVEEGGLKTSREFLLREREAYPSLYQECAARKTADKGITVLQGRTVGGGTTVNWTSCFRTPADTLRHWRDVHGLSELTDDALAPFFARAEARLGVTDWAAEPNVNNALLEKGCRALGVPSRRIRRNVRGCWNLGYCGMGCPTNAKQSMLVTAIPAALARGATLLTRVRIERLESNAANDRVSAALGVALGIDGMRPTGRRVRIVARHFILAAGSVGTPAILLRSGAPDPSGLSGARTFLHPVALSGALFDARVDAFNGAPQTVYSDHFLHREPIDGPLGFKLEVPPVHPLLMAVTLPGHGEAFAAMMARLPNLHVQLALLRDGFHPDSRGGRVRLRDDGSPLLDYPFNDVLRDGLRRSLLAMAEIQFAAGARVVLPVHEQAPPLRSWQAARALIATLPMDPLRVRVVSAHVMGGAPMGPSPDRGVIDQEGRHWQWHNLVVADGSVFPTSLGVNPQLSIYAFSLRAADALLRRGA
ncbi:GMC family oxidoreductase [Paludibacterium paludis]|uniref:Oxidoreductase n=1 Tax=Paludibacterium paludis TaxID=1225769 RepID=A0A918UB45_9NEIS|nr:GMC family oxidoreductase [Paludibacterium paludis]GGY20705.1 oxidoreductase [Paludibacterium paludis]